MLYDLIDQSDFYLGSDRGGNNNIRLAGNWRPVWQNMFKEFPDTKFFLYHTHDALKFPVGSNVHIVTEEKIPKNINT